MTTTATAGAGVVDVPLNADFTTPVTTTEGQS